MDYCNICERGGKDRGPYISYKIDNCYYRKCNPCYTKEGLAEQQREREIKEAPRATVLALQNMDYKLGKLLDAITKVNERVAATEGCPVDMYYCGTCNHYAGIKEYRSMRSTCRFCNTQTLKRVTVMQIASYAQLQSKEEFQNAAQDASSGP